MKDTGELRAELMEQADLDAYIKENARFFADKGVVRQLNRMFQERNISKADLARQAGMSEVYLHQVFSGRRTPSRDRLICLCISLGADLETIQLMLKQAAYAPLYPKTKRDSIICHGILHHTKLAAINQNLYEKNEKTLF